MIAKAAIVFVGIVICNTFARIVSFPLAAISPTTSGGNAGPLGDVIAVAIVILIYGLSVAATVQLLRPVWPKRANTTAATSSKFPVAKA